MEDSLVHIRISKEMKKKMQYLIDKGLFSNHAEIIRESIRYVLLRYTNEK